MKPNPHPVPSSVRKRFSDNFIRDNTSNTLGITEDGSRWDILKGIFKIFGGRATSDTDPNSYPMATVTMPYEDVSLDLLEIDNGSSAALWVTGSGDWWAVGLDQEIVDCNCDVGTECNRWNSSNCARRNDSNCNRWECSSYSGNNRGSCSRWNQTNINFECVEWRRTSYPRCSRWDSFGRCTRVNYVTYLNCERYGIEDINYGNCAFYPWNANNCTGNSCNRWNSTNCIAYNAKTCNQWFEFTFNCETCYPQYIRVLQSVGNTISTVFSKLISPTFREFLSPNNNTLYEQDNLNDPTVKSMSLRTSGKEISIDVYEGLALEDQINVGETIVYEPTNAEVTARYGIMIKPSEYNQQNFIGEIDIDKNF